MTATMTEPDVITLPAPDEPKTCQAFTVLADRTRVPCGAPANWSMLSRCTEGAESVTLLCDRHEVDVRELPAWCPLWHPVTVTAILPLGGAA